ncbi:MAG: Bax inhibitor-1/YccA family protein [Gammaproteobacteria bacterium]|nr:Bax inhibitor-1/YccA family protein [Gammaproteobacteria bacterium]
MRNNEFAIARGQESALSTNKVLRQTYMLLSMTLLFSGLTAGVSMAINPPIGVSMIASLVSLGLLWFVVPRTANSAAGIWVVFLVTGLLGFGLGPILNHYAALPNGGQLVMTALGGTGVVFLGLSGYALTTRKDFSFMAGFIFTGVLVAFIAGIAAMIFNIPALSLGVSAMFIMLMSGYILYQTSEIIHGGETNYILATIGLYVAIYNIFTSLLHLLGAFGGND